MAGVSEIVSLDRDYFISVTSGSNRLRVCISSVACCVFVSLFRCSLLGLDDGLENAIIGGEFDVRRVAVEDR